MRAHAPALTRAALVWLAPVVAVFAAVVAIAAPQLAAPTSWRDPDSLFYEAQVLEVRGIPQATARRTVFDGPLASFRRAKERAYHRVKPDAPYHVLSPTWVAYSAQFYRRRWLVPTLAAAVQPLAGDQALRVIDVVGFLLVAPILFLLCRRQFSMTASALAAVSVGILPMLRNVAVEPMTDTFGLALEASALLVGLVTYERGLRWLPLWVATIAVLAFTRDAAVIPIVGVAWLLVLHRSRVAAAMVATGVAAAAPPFILFGGSLRRTLAYTFSGFNPPTRTSWSFILRRFPDALTNMVGDQIRYLFHHPGTALLFAVAAAALYLSRRRSTYLSFFRAAGIAAVGLAYSIPQNDPDLRLGLVVLPIVVVGVALAIDQLRTYVGRMPSAFRFLEPGWPHRG